ncbi:MAG TPA: methyltransferase domain-containing protein, partial [Vicinamibacterales bacterium]|nr:methyltransferase domain-containing protein [Vicinamibacterales bacterium]
MLVASMDLRELPAGPFARHPWEIARARFFTEVVCRWIDPAQPIDVLDVGAGDGYLGRELLGRLPCGSKVSCFDSNYTLEHLDALGGRVTAGLTFSRDCSGRRYDWLMVLDVLEHVRDDVAWLTSLVTDYLKPGGFAVVSAPTWPRLFTSHDERLGHFRRYRPALLDRVVAQSGLEELEAGSMFTSLLLPRIVARLLENLRGVRARPHPSPAEAHVETELSSWRGGRRTTAA